MAKKAKSTFLSFVFFNGLDPRGKEVLHGEGRGAICSVSFASVYAPRDRKEHSSLCQRSQQRFLQNTLRSCLRRGRAVTGMQFCRKPSRV